MKILKKLGKGLQHFKLVAKAAHKPYVVILFEAIYWSLSLGKIGYYFDYELYLKGNKITDYVSPTEFVKIEKKLNTPEYYPILEDKYFFNKVLEGSGLRSPRNLYLVEPAGIFDLQSAAYITEQEFVRKDMDGFCKIINGFGGRLIYKMELVKGEIFLNKKLTTVSEFLRLIGNRKYLIQERILQHEQMNALNPSCLNTMRVLTIKTGQTIHLFQPYLRIGINNSFVDNSLSGNIMIGIQKDGSLMEFAHSSFMDSSIDKVYKHPQTGQLFKEFTIPFFDESMEMAKVLHQRFQQFFMIGWDIGITPEGPVVIEGNNITTLHPYQVIYGGLNSQFTNLAKSYQEYL